MSSSDVKDTIYGSVPADWDMKKIIDYAEIVTDYVANGSFASLKQNVQYKDEPDVAVLIRLVDYNNSFKGEFVYISEDSYNFLKKSKLYGDEIIISNVGANVGTVFKCPRLRFKMSLAPNSIMMRTKGHDDFYYYWLKSGYGQFAIKSIVSGSAQPKFNKTDFRNLTVPVPPIPEQKAIAATLSCLDDKIELNNRMNKNLEEMAQAIFKSWFVDFEPFQDGEFEDSELGMIPKGWRVGSLDQVANYLNGLAMQKYRPDSDEYLPVIKIKELNQEQVDSNSDKARTDIPKQYIIENGDVVFSWSGTLLVKIWTGGKGALNQHLFKVTSDKYDKWFYYLWTMYHLEKFKGIASDKATTMGHIKRSHLSEAKVIIPDENSFEKLNCIMQPLLKQIIDIKVQNGMLKDLRDLLLPKLMSGEIRVPLEEVQ